MIKSIKIKKDYTLGIRGVTVTEILVVVAVMGLIFSVTLPQFSKVRENQVLKSAAGDIISSINKARSQTLASVNSSSYGVHFETDKIVIFPGTDFYEGEAGNEVINMISPASITSIDLSGGEADIYFNRITGTPSSSGTIVISAPSYSKTITISATGVASVN